MISNVDIQLKSQLSNILPLILKETPNKQRDKQQKNRLAFQNSRELYGSFLENEIERPRSAKIILKNFTEQSMVKIL